MFLTCSLLVLGAICVCAGGIVKTFRFLELDAMQTLMWIGLAEEPLPHVAARRR
ncbi:MAG TPA: hypothetical protein VFZ89_09990 [Solirubrobacteraceae bacterium]